jgi:hypothetical protein
LDVYHFQFANNWLYQEYCQTIGRTPGKVNQMEEIPFLPISFFKSHQVTTTAFEPELIFKSSGTTGMTSSTHFVKSAELYEKSFFTSFEHFYGPVSNYAIIGLLPSYLERGQSSLVYMVDQLIKASGKKESGFYLHDFERLHESLFQLEASGQKTILIGVTYALLDFAARFPMQLKHTLIMETGGMKGRRKEMIRSELYDLLRDAFGVPHIHSEYGMTELLSQAYSIDGLFKCPDWMKILLRDETDPFDVTTDPQERSSGVINVIDLANIYSCSFIATEDLGKLHEDHSFEVLGRLDNSDIRGCSLLVPSSMVNGE